MKNTQKLSIRARFVLTHIKYRTNNNRLFYAGNEEIAKIIGCTTETTKKIINQLIRDGYLLKTTDRKKRRNLALSGKKFQPLDGVKMDNIDKTHLKQEVEYHEYWENYYQKEFKRVESDNDRLREKLNQANEYITKLEEQLIEFQESKTTLVEQTSIANEETSPSPEIGYCNQWLNLPAFEPIIDENNDNEPLKNTYESNIENDDEPTLSEEIARIMRELDQYN